MGLYNTFWNKNQQQDIQLKVGNDLCLRDFYIGDKVDILDGVYFAYEGIVIIQDGVYVACVHNTYDKWGNLIIVDWNK